MEQFDWITLYNAYVTAVRTHRYWTVLHNDSKMVAILCKQQLFVNKLQTNKTYAVMMNDSDFFGDDDVIDNYTLSQKAVATTNKERTDERRLKTFCETVFGEKRAIEEILVDDLNRNFVPFFHVGKNIERGTV